MKCPFEQMAEDARTDARVMRRCMQDRSRKGYGHGDYVWAMVSWSYSYEETIQMLGMDSYEFDQWWRERHGR